MHIRTISRETPAAAAGFESILFFANGVFGIISTIVGIISSTAGTLSIAVNIASSTLNFFEDLLGKN